MYVIMFVLIVCIITCLYVITLNFSKPKNWVINIKSEIPTSGLKSEIPTSGLKSEIPTSLLK